MVEGAMLLSNFEKYHLAACERKYYLDRFLLLFSRNLENANYINKCFLCVSLIKVMYEN